MFFNSIDFAVFLPVVFVLYWFLLGRSIRLQNALLLVASYYFYGCWDWRFLSLIVFSSFVDFFVGIGLGKSEDKSARKLLLLTSVVVNIGFLAFFKYCNFFIQSFNDTFAFFGQPLSDPFVLNIVLPVGISFYTFQTLSYSIDVYRRQIEPTKDIVSFFAFVSFFPQLVAGPIERAANLLPQFEKKRSFDFAIATDGMRQILWGLFKKIVIADNCAVYVNDIFANHHDLAGSTLWMGGIFFAFQIYCDFSGYSDIAIGTSRLFGFTLMRNFAFPYFSRDIAEFWRRWHISLSTWFRDYIYIPLGGSRGGTLMNVRNIGIIFVVSGFWHGANWTFVVWGALNALYFLPIMLLKKNRANTNTVAEGRLLPSIKETFQMATTFFLTIIAWIFFRAANVTDAIEYLGGMFSTSVASMPEIYPTDSAAKIALLLIVVFMVVEWLGRFHQFAIAGLRAWPKPLRWSVYYTIILAIYFVGNHSSNLEFIYFQF